MTHFMPRLMTACAAAAMLAAIAPSAHAQSDDDGIWEIFQGAKKMTSDNGDFVQLRGRILWDYASLTEELNDGTVIDVDGEEFRAIRFGVTGKWRDLKYKAEVDFAGDDIEAKAVNVTYTGWPIDVKIGQQKTNNSFHEVESSRHVTFIERAGLTDAFGFDRRLGITLNKSGKTGGAQVGIFGNSINGEQDGRPTTTVGSARGWYTPVQDSDTLVHVGGHFRYTSGAEGAPKRSARWGSHLAKQKITPEIGAEAKLFGAEIAGRMGAFHGQAEYVTEEGDLGTADGAFVQVGYYLTGERRRYKGSVGAFDRTKPLKPLSAGGAGAWEIAARFDTLDATDAGDQKLDAYTLGLNWYPESHLRVSANYTDADASQFVADGFYMRFQYDW